MSTQNTLSLDDLIEQVDEALGPNWRSWGCSNPANPGIIETCEAFYVNGFADESGGDMNAGGHFYRVHRWIIHTDSQGFNEYEEFDTEDEARKAFEKYQNEFYDNYDDGSGF